MGRKFVVQRTWNEEGEDIAISLCENGFDRFKHPVKFDSQQAVAVCKTLEDEDSEKARADVEKLKAKGENVDEEIDDYPVD